MLRLTTHLDLWWVGSLDIRQRALVELLLESFSEQDGELGVVDQLKSQLANFNICNRRTGIPKSTAARREA